MQEALDASHEDEANKNGFVLGTDEDYQKVPQGVTVTLPHDKKINGGVSAETPGTPPAANGNGRAGSPTNTKTEDDNGVEISKEELLKSRTYPWSTILASANS